MSDNMKNINPYNTESIKNLSDNQLDNLDMRVKLEKERRFLAKMRKKAEISWKNTPKKEKEKIYKFVNIFKNRVTGERENIKRK